MFHIINSMDVPTYLMMLLTALGLNVYSLIKYRKVKAPWKVLLYGNPVILIVLAINRVIEEYAPDTHLYNVSVTVTLTIGGIFFIALIVVAYITKKSNEAILFSRIYYLSQGFNRLSKITSAASRRF